MNVLIITRRYPPSFDGGGEISVSLLAEQLRVIGFNVTVIAYDGQADEVINGIRIIRIPWKLGGLTSLLLLRKHAKKSFVVHAYNMTMYEWIGFLSDNSVATLNQLPSVIDRGGFIRRITRCLRWGMISKVDRFIALSAEIKSLYESRGLRNISIIPNMLDPYYREECSKIVKSNGMYNILYVGALSEHKGVDILIRACSDLDGYTLRIVGVGDKMESLKRLAASLSINVEFAGYVENKSLLKFYDEADIMVHPGRWSEPFGRTIIEAMSRGLPSIVSNIGEPPNLVADERFVFEVNNSASLCKKLSYWKDRSAELQYIGLELKEKSARYAPDVVLRDVLRVYKGETL